MCRDLYWLEIQCYFDYQRLIWKYHVHKAYFDLWTYYTRFRKEVVNYWPVNCQALRTHRTSLHFCMAMTLLQSGSAYNSWLWCQTRLDIPLTSFSNPTHHELVFYEDVQNTTVRYCYVYHCLYCYVCHLHSEEIYYHNIQGVKK